jgi:APA family basic amino acid/polyamine antiporter
LNKYTHIQKIGLATAFSIVVANMIGTGVFTSLGFQITEIKSVFALLMLWLIGGLIALSGALSYGELAAALPRSGGEYHFLSKIYHPILGFLAGWVSILVGFAAPTALAAMAMGSYAQSFVPFAYPGVFAIFMVVVISLIHSFQIRIGGQFQRIVTFLKIALIIFFIFSGVFIGEPQSLRILPRISDWQQVFSSSFAVSLIFVSYAFSGWNASVYITDEITSPRSALEGKIEIGFISATNIFGESGGKIMALVITLLLVSTLSAMIWIGPRVTMVMGEDYRILRFLSRKNKYGVPVIAIWIQTGITMVLIISSTFEEVLVYAGFVLNIFTLLSVIGVFILRMRHRDLPRPYKVWGYPITPVFFILLSLWTLTYLMIDRTTESILGLITVLSGILIYLLNKYAVRKRSGK